MTRSFFIVSVVAAALVAVPIVATPAAAQKKTPPKKPASTRVAPPNNGEATKGTTQIKGGDGVFGTIYTVVNGSGNNYNLQLIKARYTLEPHNDYEGTLALPEQKLFVADVCGQKPEQRQGLGFGRRKHDARGGKRQQLPNGFGHDTYFRQRR